MLMNDLCFKIVLPGVLFQLLIAISGGGGVNVTTTHKPMEEVIINGTRVEVTTVKIAEIINHHYNTTILKAVTARHFTTSTTQASHVILRSLIPPANHSAQIRKRLKENLTWVADISQTRSHNHMIKSLKRHLMKLKVKFSALQQIAKVC